MNQSTLGIPASSSSAIRATLPPPGKSDSYARRPCEEEFTETRQEVSMRWCRTVDLLAYLTVTLGYLPTRYANVERKRPHTSDVLTHVSAQSKVLPCSTSAAVTLVPTIDHFSTALNGISTLGSSMISRIRVGDHPSDALSKSQFTKFTTWHTGNYLEDINSITADTPPPLIYL
jgi:hypothetical protein